MRIHDPTTAFPGPPNWGTGVLYHCHRRQGFLARLKLLPGYEYVMAFPVTRCSSPPPSPVSLPPPRHPLPRQQAWARIGTHALAHVHTTHTHAQPPMHTRTQACTHTYLHSFAHAHKHANTLTHTHINTHARAHTRRICTCFYFLHLIKKLLRVNEFELVLQARSSEDNRILDALIKAQ